MQILDVYFILNVIDLFKMSNSFIGSSIKYYDYSMVLSLCIYTVSNIPH